MPVAGTTPMVNGAVMEWTDLSSNFELWRDYLNGGLVVGDVTAGSLTRENLYRPEFYGYPVQGTVAPTRQVFRLNERIHQPHAVQLDEWRTRRETFIIKPWRLPQSEAIQTDISRTFRLTRTSVVVVTAQTEYRVAHKFLADGGPRYPDGAGVGDIGGFLILAILNRTTGTLTTYNRSRVDVYPTPSGSANTNLGQHVEMELTDTLTAGVYDVWVQYERGLAPTTLLQVNLGRANMRVETFS